MLAEAIQTIGQDSTLTSLRIRVTATHRNPNAVLLIGNRGDVFIETGLTGKVMIARSTTDRDELLRLFREKVDVRAHANRYLGGAAPF